MKIWVYTNSSYRWVVLNSAADMAAVPSSHLNTSCSSSGDKSAEGIKSILLDVMFVITQRKKNVNDKKNNQLKCER
jgi:hypothetical protein